ncbi:MAG: VCBS repeat-containing protein [Lentisphaerae bacterium]|nr:VCBS repeat-containing protein [Lentisphaerota bacterium]
MAIGDVDADGDLDMYAVGGNVMLRNEGKMRFSDVTAKSGLDTLEPNIGVYSPMFVDWNNDGKLDLFLAAGSFDSLAFQGGGGFSFSEVTGTIGLDCYAIHGCGFGDLDGDGDLDFYGTTWAQYDFALRRNNQDDGNYLKIRVKGRKSNTSGIGARVWVYDAGGQGANRRLRGYSEVLGGGVSMYTCPVLEQHFGVPGSGKYDVEVLFPVSGKRVKLSGEAAARTLTVEEPEDHGNDQGAGDKTK